MSATDRAPRPEGMSEQDCFVTRNGVEAEILHSHRGDVVCVACEINELRADGATLKARADEAHAAHSASFGALQTLSAALFDGEVDDYAELAEKIIARVKQAEADEATLRERVKDALTDFVLQAAWLANDHSGADAMRKVLVDAIFASPPKEPTP